MKIENIKIIHEINETYREVYYFDINLSRINHRGTMNSYRDDENDVWGDLWYDYTKEQKNKEVAILDQKYEDVEEEDPEYYSEYEKISKKYNPTCLKTIHGKTRYSGTFGGNLPEPLISQEEIKKKILNELTTFVNEATF